MLGQTERKCLEAESVTSPAHVLGRCLHDLAFLIILTNTLRDKGSPVLSDKPTGAASVLHILSFLNAWKESVMRGMAVLPLLPTGLSRRGPRVSTLVWVSASALCLAGHPRLHRPPAGYMSGPDRLPDSGIYLVGSKGERAPRYPSHRAWQTLCFFPFFIAGAVCHSWWQARQIPCCPSHRCTVLSHHVIGSPSRGRHLEKVREIHHCERMENSLDLHFKRKHESKQDVVTQYSIMCNFWLIWLRLCERGLLLQWWFSVFLAKTH